MNLMQTHSSSSNNSTINNLLKACIIDITNSSECNKLCMTFINVYDIPNMDSLWLNRIQQSNDN